MWKKMIKVRRRRWMYLDAIGLSGHGSFTFMRG
jgi:hypothetical protein